MEMYKNNLVQNGTVVYTDDQSAGRGQMQKHWVSKAYENLLFSIVLKPVTNYISNPFILNKCITLAVYNFIQEQFPETSVAIKWPNDILVNKKKIAGILVENSFMGQLLTVTIAGIGININQSFEDQPQLQATSFLDLKEEVSEREVLFEKVLETIDAQYLQLVKGTTNQAENDFDLNLLGFGMECTFSKNDTIFTAQLLGCDSDGRLLLKELGKVKKYMHGEIKQIIY